MSGSGRRPLLATAVALLLAAGSLALVLHRSGGASTGGPAPGAGVAGSGARAPAGEPVASEPPAADVAASEHRLDVGGGVREWTEVAPPQPVPGGALVLGLPGLSETRQVLRVQSGLDRLVAEGVTVAYVAGFERSWDAGTCCGPAAVRRLDDLAVLHAVAREVIARRGLDPRRVFLVGHSNGAMMALRAACEEPSRWAGALSVAGAVVVPGCDARGTRLVLWQGERDVIVPVAGRVFPGGGSLPAFAVTVQSVAAAEVTVLRDPVGTHEWPQPTGALVDRAWGVLRDARAVAGP